MRRDLILVGLMVAILALMIVPISQRVIDILLAINISLSIVLLLVAIYLKHSSDFSTFPAVILISTAFRLALSIGTTRLILSEADAGQIVKVFGDFVVAGNVAIGLVIFLIITAVQFLVVTKGAERVAEVGARFALDALPGKQMSIDADLRAGVIDAATGERLRKRLDKDSQFFGAMDGAMKFVKGDAIAGLIIIAINLIGGVTVGALSHGMSMGEAISIYSLLTVGDGLVAQIPALLLSMCAGVVVTRVAHADNEDLGTDISRELLSESRVTGVAAVIVTMIGFIPGFPTLIFLCCGATLMALSFSSARRQRAQHSTPADTDPDTAALADPVPAGTAPLAPRAPVSDRMIVVLGAGLEDALDPDALRLAIGQRMDDLSAQHGVAFPHIDLKIDHADPSTKLMIECDEVPMLRDVVPPDHILVRCEAVLLQRAGCKDADIQKVLWSTFNGYWVPKRFRLALKDLAVEIETLEDRLADLVVRQYRQNLGLLFGTAEFDTVLDSLRAQDPQALDAILDAIPKATLFAVIQSLIEDEVPIRPAKLILKSLQSCIQGSDTKSVEALCEALRSALKRQMCHALSAGHGILGLVLLDPNLDSILRRKVNEIKRSSGSDMLVLPPKVHDALIASLTELTGAESSQQHRLVLVAPPNVRKRLRDYVLAHGINIPVVAPHEISEDIQALPVDVIKAPASAMKPAKDKEEELEGA